MEKITKRQAVQSRMRSVPYLREARQTRLLKTLLLLAVIYTLYLAKSLLIPLFFSAFIALLLSPLVRIGRKFYVPPSLSAAVLMALLVAPFTFLGLELAEPAGRWMHSLPKIAGELVNEMEEISDNLTAPQAAPPPAKKEESSFLDWFSDDEEEPIPEPKQENIVTGKLKQSGMEIAIAIMGTAPLLLAQIFACMILIFFLLVYGPSLFNVVIRDFPAVTNKRRALVLVNHIQRELSNYIVTVSMINGLLGVATAVTLTYLGIEDAILWGSLVALLNFVPYLGGLLSCSILLVAGVVQFGLVAAALLPSAAFLCINIIESQFVTPTILGKSMRLNPLIIILWLSITGWLWGIVGVLLAVPILMSFKIILENIGSLPHWVKLIESK